MVPEHNGASVERGFADLVAEIKAKKPKKPATTATQRKAFEKIAAKPSVETTPAARLVMAHVAFFELVYGFVPSDTVDNFLAACSSAKSLMDKVFDGSEDRAASYVRWAWRRERKLKKWVAGKGENETKKPATWRRIFQARDLVDMYRAEALRRDERRV
jgi:hypothetical protein